MMPPDKEVESAGEVEALPEDASLRDTLSAAFEDAGVKDDGTVEEQPEGEGQIAKTAAASEAAPEKKGLEGGDPKEVGKPEAKPAAAAAKQKAIPKSVEEGGAEAQLAKSKAPGSWKPAAREVFNSLPVVAQQEILRREREIAHGFNEVAQVKRFRDEFGGIVNQYQAVINAEGGNAMKMTRDLYTTAAALYHGSPMTKVQTVAGFIKNFGIDIAMLDQVLSGQAPAQPQGQQAQGGQGSMQVEEYINQRIQQALQPIFGQQDQQLHQEASQSIDQFRNDPKNEFFEDVKETMADLLEVATKQGKKLSLQDAYQRATMLHSDIAEVITERSLRERAASNSSVAAAARRKAVSLKQTPSTELATGDADPNKPTSLREDILAAAESLSG
jgi:hypothetical protein